MFSGKMKCNDEFEVIKNYTFEIFLIAGMFLVPIFAFLKNIFLKNSYVAFAGVIAEIVLIIAFILLRKEKEFLSKILFSVAVGVLLVGVILQGDVYLYVWFGIFPALTFIILDSTSALIVSLVFAVVAFIVNTLLHMENFGKEIYFVQEVAIFYIFMVAGSFFYSMIMEKQKFLLRWMCYEDPVTNLMQRDASMPFIEKELAESLRYKKPLSFVLMDIDDFRKFNKDLGSKKGDEFLSAFTGEIRKNLRGSDFVVRWGGDEFLFLLSNTDVEGAKRTAEKIRDIFKDISSKFERSLTASIGVLEYTEAEAAEEVIKNLEETLYKAKNKGGNTIEFSIPGGKNEKRLHVDKR